MATDNKNKSQDQGRKQIPLKEDYRYREDHAPIIGSREPDIKPDSAPSNPTFRKQK